MDAGMSPADTSKASGGSQLRWNSPVPYIFGGLAVILGVLVVALLVVLACFHCKSTAPQSSGDTGENPTKNMNTQYSDMEPKFVVIMAGDDLPTYLAKPLSSTSQMEHA
ncbi:hypothetical protein L1049_028311 [Liquidambar formosana]|uniref:Uncharacterized protein n=1 Tax=Liquidambar formosana TaxID=63359 RepID=A0AAP0RKQ2_LIQFO